MKAEHRVWWEELAEQYREWAVSPPRNRLRDELYTCEALRRGDWGFYECPAPSLMELWRFRYGDTVFPIPRTWHSQIRNAQRPAFCNFMADTIESYLEDGTMPWEVSACA
jgi:hypothetical protein